MGQRETNLRRVAVTGIGAITPIGLTASELWQGILDGRSGLGPITSFDASKLGCQIAAEIPTFDAKAHFEHKVARNTERFTQFAIVAAREAVAMSGIKESGLSLDDIGCVVGSGIGGIGFTEEAVLTMASRGPGKVTPFLIPRIIANMASGYTSMDLGLKGPNFTVITACAAGSNAIGEASEIIRRGDATAMICGGTESAICQIAIAGFDNMKALCSDSNENPVGGSRPFDATRSGFVMGEGAGMMVIEDWDHAVARGAKILAEVRGYGASADAHHITAPAPGGEGAVRAMKIALRKSGLSLESIGYINAHGTSTELNDKLETEAIKTVFGDHARKLAVSSSKSQIGHLLGAAGGVEAVICVLALQNQTLPPTINYKNPDPECDLDYVPNAARKVEGLRIVMSNSLGFGGHNSVLALALPD